MSNLLLSEVRRFRTILFLGLTGLILAFGLHRLQLIRGEPWYTAPPYHAGSQPKDINPECLRSFTFPGLGDLKSVICQSRLHDPYSQATPSTQTPVFLFVHKLVDQIPVALTLGSIVAILTLLTIYISTRQSGRFGYQFPAVLSVTLLPILSAVERGNFFYAVSPFVLIFLYHFSRSFTRNINYKGMPEGLPESAVISSLTSLKPTLLPLLLLGLERRKQYSLMVIAGTIAISVAVNLLIGAAFYDVSGYLKAILIWQGYEFPFPDNVYSVHPSSIQTITGALEIGRLVPTAAFNLFALVAPLCIFAIFVGGLCRSEAPKWRPLRLLKDSFDLDDRDVAISLYVASVLALVASGAMYQTAVPIALLALKMTERDASKHWRWQVCYLAALLMPSIGIHRALLPFSPLLASAVHTVVVLTLWITPSLFCLRTLVVRGLSHGLQSQREADTR